MINCKNLVLGYNNRPITTPMYINIRHSQWVGVVGQNGIGKSTFFKALISKNKPLSGEIKIDGKSVQKANELISYIPQEREINYDDKTSGLTLAKATYKGSKLGLPFWNSDFKKHLSYLVELTNTTNYIKVPFKNLSGGQKKRIYLLQALINKPEILLLDEPLSDLDPVSKQKFLQVLKEIHKNTSLTVLLISHDMQEISHQLDWFLHFKDRGVHLCNKLPCLSEDANV